MRCTRSQTSTPKPNGGAAEMGPKYYVENQQRNVLEIRTQGPRQAALRAAEQIGGTMFRVDRLGGIRASSTRFYRIDGVRLIQTTATAFYGAGK